MTMPAEAAGSAPGRGRLTGRRVLVVGAGTRPSPEPDPPIGNGRAISVLAAREGAAVACADRDAGELVLLDNRAANHDPAVFPSPGRFDITREGLAHLTFGHGAHYCLGAPLARVELQAVFAQLLARFPAMRLAVPVEQLRVRSDAVTGGLTGLPVEW